MAIDINVALWASCGQARLLLMLLLLAQRGVIAALN